MFGVAITTAWAYNIVGDKENVSPDPTGQAVLKGDIKMKAERKIKRKKEEGLKGKKSNEWCIFKLAICEFFGHDCDEDYVILVNGRGKFIIGKKFANCISLGEYVSEYNTYSDAYSAIKEAKI